MRTSEVIRGALPWVPIADNTCDAHEYAARAYYSALREGRNWYDYIVDSMANSNGENLSSAGSSLLASYCMKVRQCYCFK